MELLDCRGKACPIPVVETKAKLTAMKGGEMLEVWVDGEVQIQNILRMLDNNDATGQSSEAPEGGFKLKIMRPAVFPRPAESCGAPVGKACVVISADHMGEGDEKLGHILIKSFFFALRQSLSEVETIVAYNGGVKLFCEGSEVLEDLQAIKDGGVEIQVCGTCLDFYGLKEQLKVGTVSNMYSIVEAQTKAGKILRP